MTFENMDRSYSTSVGVFYHFGFEKTLSDISNEKNERKRKDFLFRIGDICTFRVAISSSFEHGQPDCYHTWAKRDKFLLLCAQIFRYQYCQI